MRIAINGFGRIGRMIFRIAIERGFDIVAINDVHGIDNTVYLLKYDSVYGRFNKKISTKGKKLIVDGKEIEVISQRDPSKLPWKRLKVDIVVEATGAFRERKQVCMHQKSGATYAVLTAPCKGKKDVDITVIIGVNDNKLKKSHKIISVASCTTNCLVPIAKVLHDKYKIKWGTMSTIHAYTNDQALQDSSHRKTRRGRAAAQNIIPTTTGASESIAKIIPDLLGKIQGIAVRVPVATGSLVDLTLELQKKFTVKQVNQDFKKLASEQMNGILGYTEDPIVSSDIIGDSHSAMVDGLSTSKEGNLLRVLAWYDNEYGYSSRVVDVIAKIEARQIR